MSSVTPFRPRPAGGLDVGSRVRVIDTDSNFFNWEGEVVEVLNTNRLLDPVRYQIKFRIANDTITMPPMLFKPGTFEVVV